MTHAFLSVARQNAITAGYPGGFLFMAPDEQLLAVERQPTFCLTTRVDLSQNGNLIMVAVTLVLGTGDFALTLGGFTLGGIGTATFGAILLNALLSRRLVDVPPPEVVHQEP